MQREPEPPAYHCEPGNGTTQAHCGTRLIPPGRDSVPTNLPASAADPRVTPRRVPRRHGWLAAELLAVFAVGVTVMNFIYIDPRGVPADQIGVPGYDAFYHTKMAAMLPEYGLVDDFPWLRHVYFSQLDSSFISHHTGFHILLAPFVGLSHWLTGDYLAGGRWAIATCFGVVLVLMQMLLMSAGVRWRWLWLVAIFLLPPEFMGRHSYVRAICPSLMFMLAIVYLVFRERCVLAGIAIAAYVHLYLGSVIYAPVIVGTYAACSVIGPREDRRFPWRLVLWATLGWLVGLRTYPYFDGALEFLRMQVLGTGLDPDIEVGGEWNSYGNVWHFAVQMCGPVLIIWATALVLRVRLGARLSAQEMTLVVLNFTFLFLTFKAKRFIEYWPPFCLLSAAFMVAPVLNDLTARLDPTGPAARSTKAALRRFCVAFGVCLGAGAIVYLRRPEGIERFLAEWPLWTMLATALLLPPLLCIWRGGPNDAESGRGALQRTLIVMCCGVVFAGGISAVGRFELGGSGVPAAQLFPGAWGWLVLALFYFVFAYRARRVSNDAPSWTTASRLIGTSTVMSTGVAVVAAVVLLCASRLVALQRDIYCGYNLPAIRDAMAYLEDVSDPGDVLFTDDWDVFPVFFYHNTHNNYIVGLDPKFTHHRKPELWDRYVKITRGLTPRTFESHWTAYDGTEQRREIEVRLEDIRDYFGAEYVIVDSDHTPFARKLAEAKEFVELVYPKSEFADCVSEPYLIFRVRGAESRRSSAGLEGEREPLFLSDMTPLSVSQGWGELTSDRSVSDRPIRLADTFYPRGLGTHAPLELEYGIPSGYDKFVATVGVNGFTQKRGSVVISIALDGREVYRSPIVTAESRPIPIRLGLAGADRLTLRALPTSDGNHWDHVDWAMARLLPARP